FLHERPARLQIPQDVRVDRVVRQLALREPCEQQLVRTFRPGGLSPSGVTETTLPSGPFATSAQPLRRSHPRATASSPSSNLQAAWSLGTDILPPALINARRAFRSGSALRATAGVASRKEWTTRSFIVTRPFACSHDAAFITSTSSRNFPAAFNSSGDAFLSLPSARRTFFSR